VLQHIDALGDGERGARVLFDEQHGDGADRLEAGGTVREIDFSSVVLPARFGRRMPTSSPDRAPWIGWR
jgi:hypothetical protein